MAAYASIPADDETMSSGSGRPSAQSSSGILSGAMATLTASETLPFTLCPAAAALQLAHDLEYLTEDHVGVQAIYRLCLQVLGRESELKTLERSGKFRTLKEFCMSMHHHYGEGAVMLMHGKGMRGRTSGISRKEYAKTLNFGTYSHDSVRESLPEADNELGKPITHHLLNTYEAAFGSPTTFIPVPDKRVAVMTACSDGMVVKCGLEAAKVTGGQSQVFGLVEGPLSVAEVQSLLILSSAEQAKKILPRLATQVEVAMLCQANGEGSRVIGFNAAGNGGTKDDVISRLQQYFPVKSCKSCIEEAYDQGLPIEVADAMCDMYCPGCANAYVTSGRINCEKHSGLLHWTQRRCTRCASRGIECFSFHIIAHSSDCGCAQLSAMKEHGRTLEAGASIRREVPTVLSSVGGVLPSRPHLEMELMSDHFHDGKNSFGSQTGHNLLCNGYLVGQIVLRARWDDACLDHRRRFRAAFNHSKRHIRARDQFDPSAGEQCCSEPVQRALVTDVERAQKEALVVATLSPERYLDPTKNQGPQAPISCAYHAKKGCLFILDQALGELLQLSVFDTPGALGVCLKNLPAPRDLCIHDKSGSIFITVGDDRKSRTGLATMLLRASLTSRGREKKISLSIAPFAISIKAASSGSEVLLCDPWGIDVLGVNDLVLIDNNSLKLLELAEDCSSSKISTVCALPVRGTEHAVGVASFGSTMCFVTTASTLLQVKKDSSGTWGVTVITVVPLASFWGIACCNYGDSPCVCVTDSGRNAILRFTLSHPQPTIIAGNIRQADSSSYDGTALQVTLNKPVYCCFVARTLCFCELGSGFVRMITDSYVMAISYMPGMRNLWEISGMKRSKLNLLEALPFANYFEKFIRDKKREAIELSGRSDAQGPFGTFSHDALAAAQIRSQSYVRLIELMELCNIPRSVFMNVSSSAITSMPAEHSFAAARTYKDPIPTVHAYAATLPITQHEQAKIVFENGFSYPRTLKKEDHYSGLGNSATSTVYFPRERRIDQSSHGRSSTDFATCSELAKLYQPVKQQRPTDRGRSVPGARPLAHFQVLGPNTASADEGEMRELPVARPLAGPSLTEKRLHVPPVPDISQLRFAAGKLVVLMAGDSTTDVHLALLKDTVHAHNSATDLNRGGRLSPPRRIKVIKYYMVEDDEPTPQDKEGEEDDEEQVPQEYGGDVEAGGTAVDSQRPKKSRREYPDGAGLPCGTNREFMSGHLYRAARHAWQEINPDLIIGYVETYFDERLSRDGTKIDEFRVSDSELRRIKSTLMSACGSSESEHSSTSDEESATRTPRPRRLPGKLQGYFL